ncbi:MAG TPA: hypothetical protein VI299_17465 [Polyangiales bacterium]
MELDFTLELGQARLRFTPDAIVVDTGDGAARLGWTALTAVTLGPDAVVLRLDDARLPQPRFEVQRSGVGEGAFVNLTSLIQRVWHVSPDGRFVWIRHEHEARHHWIDGGALYRVGSCDPLLQVPWDWSFPRVAWSSGMLLLQGVKYPHGSMATVRLVIDVERHRARVERDEADAPSPTGELSFAALLRWLDSVAEDPIAVSTASHRDHEVEFASDGPACIVVDYDPLGISVQRSDDRVVHPWSWIRNVQAGADFVLLSTRQRVFGKLHFQIDRSALPDRFEAIRTRIGQQWLKSPQENYAWIVRSDEVRMSHWIHGGALWPVNASSPLFELAPDWDAHARWQDDERLVLRARKYPGGTPFVTLILDARQQTAIVETDAVAKTAPSRLALPAAPPGAISFPALSAWLDAYPGTAS